MAGTERIVIVGGGVAGLASAVRLCEAGLPVTLLEATELGFEASTRNQGWLHSGAWFAREDQMLAELCYASLQQTEQFAPEALEPNTEKMLYLSPRLDAARDWTRAWTAAGIPFEELSLADVGKRLHGIHPDRLGHIYQLPDRVFRPQMLMERLAAEARNRGADIRVRTPVKELLRNHTGVEGVVTASGEEIRAARVVLASGAMNGRFWSQAAFPPHPRQPMYAPVILKSHLVACRPGIECSPFCILDDVGLNHLPHSGTSVFGSGRWLPVANAEEIAVQRAEVDLIWAELEHQFPAVRRGQFRHITEWAGTAMQMMYVEQVHPGRAPRPVVINHGADSPEDQNLWSVAPGRATLWINVAEELRVRLLESLQRGPLVVREAPWARTTEH